MLGFISPSHYSKKQIEKNSDIWLGIWKVIPEKAENNSIGLALMRYIEKKYAPACISATGLNDTVVPLYQFLGYKTSKINHWFLVNNKKKTFKLVYGTNNILSHKNPYLEQLEGKKVAINTLVNLSILNQKKKNSTRDYLYIVKRYEEHPVYNYEYLALYRANILVGVIIGRFVSLKKCSCLQDNRFLAG